jgi:hypothetical protein
MRLGLLGPSPHDLGALGRAAIGLRDQLHAERVVYLGSDQALDHVVAELARQLVGPEAGDDHLLRRATATCLTGSPQDIDGFILREQQRNGLRMFESLASGSTRSVEILGGKVAVMLYDNRYLVEEDILPATLLIYGRSRDPVIKQVGRRWFLAPGAFPDAGILLLDEDHGELRATLYSSAFEVVQSVPLAAPQSLKMRVSGGS